MTMYRVQVKLIRNVQVEVEFPKAHTPGRSKGAAACKAIDEYGKHDDYEVGDFEKIQEAA